MLSVVASVYNPSILKSGAGRLLQIRSQSGLYNKVTVSLCFPELRSRLVPFCSDLKYAILLSVTVFT